jgi:TetR/AcrR family transcriptional repressor of nem operon
MTNSPAARQQLIEATKDLLWERGFEAMSPGSILERSQVGQGSLYHHFTGKADVAAVALSEVAADINSSTKGVLEREGRDAFENVIAWLTAPRDSVRGCRLGRLANETSVLASDELAGTIRGFFGSLQKMLSDSLRQAQIDGDLPADVEVAELALALVALVQGGYTLSRVYNDPSYMDRSTHAASDLLRCRAQKIGITGRPHPAR